jgi:hypothetical protein
MEMIEKILFKKWMIVVILVFTFLLIWKLAISKTVEAWTLSDKLTAQINDAIGMPDKVNAIKSNMSLLNSKIEDSKVEHSGFQNLLLDEISKFCNDHKIIVTTFPESKYYNENEFVVQTVNFSAQGGFHDLLKLVYFLEKERKIGRVSSVDFSNVKDRKSGRMYLQLTMYIQLVSKLSENKG